MKKHLGKSLTLAILLSVCGGYTMFGNVGVAEAEYITYYGTSTDNNDFSIIDVTKNNECGVTKNEDLAAIHPSCNDLTVTGNSADIIYGGYAKTSNANGNKVTIAKGAVVSGSVIGGEIHNENLEAYSANNNIVEVKGKTGIVWGGRGYNANGNTVIVSGTAQTWVTGGFATSEASNNTVTIYGAIEWIDSEGDPICAGYAYGESGVANNNTINLGGYIDDSKAVQIKSPVKLDKFTVAGGYTNTGNGNGNTLNVFGFNNEAKEISGFQNINFYIPAPDNVSTAITTANTVNLTNVNIFNTDITDYNLGQDIILLNNVNLNTLNKVALQINGKALDESLKFLTNVELDGITNIGTYVGYDLTSVANAIKLTTDKENYYATSGIDGASEVSGNVTLTKNLIVDEANKLVVKENATLTMAAGKTITSDTLMTNNGTINLNGNGNINAITGTGTLNVNAGVTKVGFGLVQKDIYINNSSKVILNNKVSIDNIAVAKEAAMEQTEPGSIVVKQKLHNDGTVIFKGKNSIAEFTGNGSLRVEDVGATVSGSLAQKGVSVMSGANLELKGNTNTIEVLSNNGTTNVNGTTTISTVTGTGTLNVNAGVTTINGSFEQKTANVESNGKLVFKDVATVDVVGIAEGSALEGAGNINTVKELNNNGTVSVKGENSIGSVAGSGTLNVNTGETTVNGSFEQKSASVNVGKLVLKSTATINNMNVGERSTVEATGNVNVKDTVFNVGTISLNGDKNNINVLTNTGTVKVKGANAIKKVLGTGVLNVDEGVTAINGCFEQKTANVNNTGKMIINGETTVDCLNVAESAALNQNGGSLVVNGDMVNNGDVTLSNLGGSDVDYKALETAKNKVTGKLTNNGAFTLENTYLTVTDFEGADVNVVGDSLLHIINVKAPVELTAGSIINNLFKAEKVEEALTVKENPEDSGKRVAVASSFDKALVEIEAKGIDEFAKFVGNGKLIVPEGMLDGETTFDANGVHKKKGATNDVVDSLAEAVSFARVEMNDIRKRMGDVRQVKETKGIWARNENGKLEGAGMDSKFHKFQIGTDKAISEKWRVGGAVSYTNGNTHYNHGTNSNKTYSGAAYGMYTGSNGEFVDVIARVGVDKSKLNFNAGGVQQHGDLDRIAFALSAEAGKTFELKNNLYVEPQAELTYTRSGSDEFTSNGAKYNLKGSDSFIGRAGFTLGYKAPENRGGVYTRLSWLHEFAGDKTLVASNAGITKTYENAGSDTWLEWAVGGQINTSKATYIYADVEKTFNAKVNEKYRVNVGMRYSF